MDQFVISSDDCLVLKAFRDSSSLREAAQLLGCDPAGLARRVQSISQQYGFLQKVNNRWQLTARGLDLVAWTEASIQSQRKILLEKARLRVASTMWFSEEILIPAAMKLKKILGEDLSLSFSVPDKGFELSLLDGSADFVIVCHPPENPEIEHRQVLEERWVLIVPPTWKKDFKAKDEKNILELSRRPFVRHSEMNHDLFLPDFPELTESGLMLDNLIGIRSAVSQGHGWSLVPEILVRRYLREEKLFQVPYEIPIHDRKVCVWWLRHRFETRRQATKMTAWLKDACV